MNRETKMLLKKNNESEKAILEENESVYTDMIVYLRGADITEYNQEKVREDLIEMIVDGQERGDDIQTVIGDNYKEIMDDIIAELPKRTRTEKIRDIISMNAYIVMILGLISLVKQTIYNASKGLELTFKLELGDLISWAIIGIVANAVVIYICKTAFETEDNKKSKAWDFIKLWILVCVFLVAIILPSILIDFVIIEVNIAVAAFAVVVLFALGKVISR